MISDPFGAPKSGVEGPETTILTLAPNGYVFLYSFFIKVIPNHQIVISDPFGAPKVEASGSKSIILLVNNKHVDYDVDYRKPQVLKYTDMFWVPFTIQTPQTT